MSYLRIAATSESLYPHDDMLSVWQLSLNCVRHYQHFVASLLASIMAHRLGNQAEFLPLATHMRSYVDFQEACHLSEVGGEKALFKNCLG